MSEEEDGKNSPAIDIRKDIEKELVCIEYPGIVKNIDNAIRTLGGMENISRAYSQKNRRLELRFRPDDLYCKPTCGDRHKTNSLLLKVTVKRCKQQNVTTSASSSENEKPTQESDPNEDGSIISTDVKVMGMLVTTFKFRNLCDFQFLPMAKKSDNSGEMESIYENLVPQGLPSLSWLEEDCPLFLPPAAFSRMDTVQSYLYRKESNEDTTTPHNIIGRTRRRRSGHAVFVTFDIDKIPKGPREVALKYLTLKFLNGEPYAKLVKMFNDRPVWSKNALMYLTKYTSDQLKYLLPAVAYYFVTGPWRVMWVRFGYDPRKDQSSRLYQTLDYRLRTLGGLKTRVKAKRSYCNYTLPYKSSPSCRPKVATIQNVISPPRENQKAAAVQAMNESVYIFRPGLIPPSRQMFYQYCDLHVPEIQEMLEKLPELPPDAKCHERMGWMPTGIDDTCREIINNYVTDILRKDFFSPKKNKSRPSTSKQAENDSDN